MPDELKPVLARQMEVYAGVPRAHRPPRRAAHRHARRARACSTTRSSTTSSATTARPAEGTVNGTFNETFIFNGAAALETPEFMASQIDDFGGPEAYNHYAVGWAHAMDTPYQWTKQVASHWGGTRNGTIVHWPNGFKAQGGAALAVPPRDRRRPDGARRGRPARADVRERRAADAASRASSMAYSFDDARRAERHEIAVLRDVRATAASTTRAGPRSPATARRG